jgi:hypothetical protein
VKGRVKTITMEWTISSQLGRKREKRVSNMKRFYAVMDRERKDGRKAADGGGILHR